MMTELCVARVRRKRSANPDEISRVDEICGRPAGWLIRVRVTSDGIRLCNRHAGWWLKQPILRGVVDAIVMETPAP